MIDQSDLATLPGFRRTVRVVVGAGRAVAELEDDYHCMTVELEHDGTCVTALRPAMHRFPWTTCPGAEAKLVETFAGQLLTEITARRDKKQNCTHLHDLAVLAAVHSGDSAGVLTYELFVSDAVEGVRRMEIRRDGVAVLNWAEKDDVLIAPDAIAGRTLFTLRDWIAELPEPEREAARLLQWVSIMAHGRTMTPSEHASARGMPANCYTFQPDRVGKALRIGEIKDFSRGSEPPLSGLPPPDIATHATV